MKKAMIKNIHEMFMFAIAMVGLMGSCSEYDGPEVPKNPQPPTPQVQTLEKVEKIACKAISTSWDSENAVLKTRGIADDYAPKYRTNAWWAKTNTEYQAKLIYSDGSSQNQTKYFYVTNNTNVFLGKGTQFVKNIETLGSTPKESTTDLGSLGELTVYEFEGYSFGIVTSSQKSPETLTFEKLSVNNLCTPQMINTYLGSEKTFIKDSLEYKLYEVEFHFLSQIEEGDNNQREVVVTKRFAENQNGTTPNGNDPEHVCYVLRNSGFDFVTEETSKSYATVYEVFSDGSEKKFEDIQTTVYNRHNASENYELIVSSFAYTEVKDVVYNMVADGTSRVSNENNQIFLTGYQNSVLTGTTSFTYRFEGHYEIPVYTDPDGKVHTMEYREYTLKTNGLSKADKSNDGVFETLPVTSSVTVTFNEKSYDLNSTVTLKVPVGNIPNHLSGLNVNNIRVDGDCIKYDLIRHFTNAPSTTTPMEVLHLAKQHADETKATEKRSYTANSTQTDTISSTPFVDGRHTGDYVEFNKTYHYADFDVVVNNKIRKNIVYTEGGFTAYIYAGEISCNQNGYTLGVVDNGDDKKHVYTDEISYGLNIGALETANSVQFVQFGEAIQEEKQLVDVKEVKVEGDKHFMYITFSDGSFDRDTVTVEKPVSLIGRTLDELDRSDFDFGKGQVDHNQKADEKTSSMNGRVIATPYEQTYPVSYNKHNHSITGQYEKYYYTYTYKGVTKGCDLTSPTLKVENTNFELGSAKEETVDNKIYKVTPVTFNYKGTYGSQNPTCKVTTSIRQYLRDVEVKKVLTKVEEIGTEGDKIHYIKITFDDNSFIKDTVTVEKPVTLTGGTVDDLYRDNVEFGKGKVDLSNKPSAGITTANGHVTATAQTQVYPVAYNGHNHDVTGNYNTFVYTYTHDGVTKSCKLTTPTLKVENTSIDLGTAKEDTVDNRIYKVIPVTFNYKGIYGSQVSTCKVTTNVRQYLRDVEIKKVLKSVEEIGTQGDNIHYIKITFDDNSFIKDTVTVEKPVTLTGGTVDNLYRDNVNFGKGNVNLSQAPVAGTTTTNGRVTATAQTQMYPVAYSGHNHNVTGTYNTFVYTYTHDGVSKSCKLTTPTLKVENTSIDLGTAKEETVNNKIYKVTPVTFNYKGIYGSKAPTCKVTTTVYQYLRDVEIKKVLKSVEETGTEGNIHYIKITFDDNSSIKDTVTVEKPVTLTGGTVDNLYRDNVEFGKGNVDLTQAPVAGTKTTNGRVTATAQTQMYPVAYNGHNHDVTGTYNTFVYTYTHDGVSKSCKLTTPTLKVENTSIDLGTAKEQTIDKKIYTVTPVTFNYTGKYGSQVKTAKVTTSVYTFVKDVEEPKYSTEYTFVAASRVLSKDAKTFHNCFLFKASGKENGLQVVIPTLGVDYFCDAKTIGNSNQCVSAVWNGKDYIPCEVIVDNAAQMFAYDGQNTSGDKYLVMTFNEAVIKGIKNYGSDINTSATPIMKGISSKNANGVITVSLNKGTIFTYHSGK